MAISGTYCPSGYTLQNLAFSDYTVTTHTAYYLYFCSKN